MRYFDHDTTACSDSRLLALRLEHGSVAIDLYWTLLERMYADETELNLGGSNIETKSVTWLVSITQEQLENYVSTMLELGLFSGDIEHLFSERAMANIAAYQQKVETARQNGKLGGRKPRAKTDKKPSRLADGNQDAKLRKEKKSMGFDEQNPILTARDAAGGESPATPRATMSQDEVKAVFESVDKADRDMMAARAQSEQWEADATTCPTEVLEAVRGCA